jgi:hypothetical protein
MIVHTADSMGTPVTKHGRCSNLYSYEGMEEWFPTPVMAAKAFTDKLRRTLDDIT